jgi:hypothetical protein
VSSWNRLYVAALVTSVALQLGCVTQYVPKTIEIDPAALVFEAPGEAAFRAKAVLTRPSGKMYVDPYSLAIDHAKATAVVVEGLTTLLEEHGVSVIEALNAVEIEVIHISVRPGNPMYCSADVTLHAAKGPARGVQGLGSSWNYEKACHLALADVGLRILQRADTRDMLFLR